MLGNKPKSYRNSKGEATQCYTCRYIVEEGMLIVCELHEWSRVAYDGLCDDYAGDYNAT